MGAEQTLLSVSQALPFGKFKGKSTADIYSGNASEIIAGFAELMQKSLELIFSKEFYSDNLPPNSLGLDRIGGVDSTRINEEKLIQFAVALHDGAKCIHEISPKKVELKVYGINGKADNWLSQIACEIAQEYMTRPFAGFSIGSYGMYRPDILIHESLPSVEHKINGSSGDPSYIYWCIRKVDGFCLPGNESGIDELDLLPIFSFDSVGVKVGKIENDFSFKLTYFINAEFKIASKEIVAKNHEKYLTWISENESDDEVADSIDYGDSDNDDYYDDDNDEDNIMRGLDSGNGDQFGF